MIGGTTAKVLVVEEKDRVLIRLAIRKLFDINMLRSNLLFSEFPSKKIQITTINGIMNDETM